MVMKVLLYFLMIILLCTNIASAYDEDDLEWACGNSKELHLGETISNGNFTVEAYNFPRSDQNETMFAGIRLYEDGIPVSDQTLVEGEDYIHEDEIRITALEFSVPSSDWTTDLPEELWAEIKMEPIGVPRFDVEFVTDKDEYFAYSTYIEVDLTIQNSGDAEAYDVDVNMDMDGLEVIGGKSHYHCSSLEKGRRVDGKTDTITFDPITLRFGIPSVIEGAEELLLYLRSNGLSTGIISRNSLESIKRSFHNFKKIKFSDFDVIITRDDPVKPKPYADGVILAAKKLKVDVKELVVVGDFLFDIQAGKNAGSITVFLNNRLEHNFSDPESDYTISQLCELKNFIRPGLPFSSGKSAKY